MNNFQKHPLKLYIQDIFRAKRLEENKYIYEMFGMQFKNIMIHGIVTSVYNTTKTTTNFELTDATASVQVYFDSKKNNSNIKTTVMHDLVKGYQIHAYHNLDENFDIMTTLKDAIVTKFENPIVFKEGDYVCVKGDIFVDDLSETRMVSGFECFVTSINREILWLEELQYLYEKFYLWKRVDNPILD